MPLILPILTSLFTGLTTFFLQYFTRIVALKIAAITLFIGLTITFIAFINASILALSVAMPSQIQLAIGWFIPSNVPLCISTYYAAVAARFIYDYKTRIITAWYS